MNKVKTLTYEARLVFPLKPFLQFTDFSAQKPCPVRSPAFSLMFKLIIVKVGMEI